MRSLRGDTSGHTDLGRLRRRREFLAAAKGRRHHAALFSLQAAPRADDVEAPLLRVGLTITKKVGRATERNRIRRRLRAALRATGAAYRDWPADLVVVARRDVLSASFDRLTFDLAGAVAALRRKTRRDAAPDRASLSTSTPDLPKRRGRGAIGRHVPNTTPHSEPPQS